MKKVFSFFLSLIIFISCFTFVDLSALASNVVEGDWGDNASWTLDLNSGELNVTGTGSLKSVNQINPYYKVSPWYEFKDSVISASLSEGITDIENCFMGCSNLVKVILPSTLQSVGDSAFAGCYSLDKVVIPNNVKYIGYKCFEAAKVRYLKLSSSMSQIPNNCFEGATIDHLYIPTSIHYAGYSSFCCRVNNIHFYGSADYERYNFYVDEADAMNGGYYGAKFYYNSCPHEDMEYFDVYPATDTDDGYYGARYCHDCNKVLYYNSVIPKCSRVTKSSLTFTANGKIQRPMVKVYDRTGKELTYKKDFVVDYSDWESTNPGVYYLTITMQGKYNHTFRYYYEIKALTNAKVQINRNIITTTGTIQRPSFTVKDTNGKSLAYKKDFVVDYSDWESTDVGRYTANVTMIGMYKGEYNYVYYINPKPTSFLTSAQGGFKAIKNGFVLTWNAQPEQITGYQIQYSTKRDFSNAATYWVDGSDSTSAIITGRASKTRYYVRIRTFTSKEGGMFYSSWNEGVKSVVTL